MRQRQEFYIVPLNEPDHRPNDRRSGRVTRALFATLLVLAASVGAVFFAAGSWIRRTFGEISVDQMLTNLQSPDGVGGTDAELGYVASFVWNALVFPLALVTCAVALLALFRGIWLWRRGSARRSNENEEISSKQQFLGFRRLVAGVVVVAIFGFGTSSLAQSVNLTQFLKSQTASVSMREYYVAPDLIDETMLHAALSGSPEGKPLNLITIYLESIEDRMGDENLFGSNLLEPVEAVTDSWDRIDGLEQYQGGGWTMAGLIGLECGFPLRGAGIGKMDIESNDIGATAGEYLPGATCIGDVLDSAGYTSVFLGGADAAFASKERYLLSHGYDEVKDLKYWLDSGESEVSDWGLSDRVLFERARDEVLELRRLGGPYQLSILTLDSHEPAHLFEYCAGEPGNELDAAVRCSMEQVRGFLEFLDQESVLQDTAVLLVGDHRKMLAEGGQMWEELSNADARTIFNRFWSPHGIGSMQSGRDQLSIFATVLDLLNLGGSDHQAGLGLSALVESAPESGALSLNATEYEELIRSRSADFYENLWQVGAEGRHGQTEV